MSTRRTLWNAAIGAALAGGTACSESHVGPGANDTTGKSPAGTYALSTVNEKPLPFTLAADDSTTYAERITAGTLVLSAGSAPGGGTYVARTTTADIVFGANVGSYLDSTWGTWTRVGPTMTLRSALDTTMTASATWLGNSVSVIDAGTGTQLTLLYAR